ncbi:adenylate/guanylate cyclase domain-containing protein [Pelagibius sp. Alg239-R121]|uniref:adenylate/guanylate cyclase domain-containing protein n=1 Tax=Pelagibius sp. Alg239-R121 TaxID=2993448 RepID=UPI0024A6B4C2|nr:adenylate/guanylate cyclase domain-containing protein [Pelagibius sp. Alg239-R121]
MAEHNHEDISAWILDQGLRGAPLDVIVAGFCQRLRAAGHPLRRASVSLRTLHPQYGAHTLVWNAKDGSLSREVHVHRETESDEFLRSPIYHLVHGPKTAIRCRLDGRPLEVDFPFVADLRAQGYTDYAATIVRFAEQQDFQSIEGIFFSCATDFKDGFSDEDLTWSGELLPLLALALKSASLQEVAVNIAEAYLGKDAGHQVLRGKVNRGSVESIDAVILFADLRGFTAATDALPREIVVERLNRYFDCIVLPVEQYGGQVLKFLGDGLLATFALEAGHSVKDVCAAALNAAGIASSQVAAFNRELELQGEGTMALDVALHLGDVMYGNVGAADRLDFTVIGPAVNEASRIEALCGPLDRNLLISGNFVEAIGDDGGRFVSLGFHLLRGVSGQREIFGVSDGARSMA